MEPTTITRRAAFASIGAIVSTAVVAAPVVATAQQGDDTELLALVDEWRKVSTAASDAWAVARPLTALAVKIFKATGKSIDTNWDDYCAVHDEVGAAAAEDAADLLSDREGKLMVRIRDIRPTTVAGLSGKFEVVRYWLHIEDQKPRDDQDVHEEFFNIFADDLSTFSLRV